jgi:hypothetical protein
MDTTLLENNHAVIGIGVLFSLWRYLVNTQCNKNKMHSLINIHYAYLRLPVQLHSALTNQFSYFRASGHKWKEGTCLKDMHVTYTRAANYQKKEESNHNTTIRRNERTVFCLCVANFHKIGHRWTMKQWEPLKLYLGKNLNRLPNHSNDTPLTKVPSKINTFFPYQIFHIWTRNNDSLVTL